MRNGTVPDGYHHYDTIPALTNPPFERTSGEYSQLAYSRIDDGSLGNVESENSDKTEVATSTFQETRVENPYTTGPGTALPVLMEESTQKTPMEMEAVTIQVPSSHENPYDT